MTLYLYQVKKPFCKSDKKNSETNLKNRQITVVNSLKMSTLFPNDK